MASETSNGLVLYCGQSARVCGRINMMTVQIRKLWGFIMVAAESTVCE